MREYCLVKITIFLGKSESLVLLFRVSPTIGSDVVERSIGVCEVHLLQKKEYRKREVDGEKSMACGSSEKNK